MVTDHLPLILAETAGDRLLEKTPRPYLRWIMAKALAARMVYWKDASLEAVSEDVIAARPPLSPTRRGASSAGERSRGISIDHRDRTGSLLLNTGIFTTMHRCPTPTRGT